MKILVCGGSGFIGRELVSQLQSAKHEVSVADIKTPEFDVDYHPTNVLNKNELTRVIQGIKPDIIINLISRTDDFGIDLYDYEPNFIGLENILSAINILELFHIPIFHFSTQYVIGPGKDFRDLKQLSPYTRYGESKAVAELILRNSSQSKWTIIRPTAVWGPFHPTFPGGFWKIIRKGLYVHPRVKTKRSFIHVETLVSQFIKIMNSKETAINKKIFYLGNVPSNPIELYNSWSRNLRGREIRQVPIYLFQVLVVASTLLKKMGINVPLDKTRSEILTQSYEIDLKSTHELIGDTGEDLKALSKKTMDWYKAL